MWLSTTISDKTTQTLGKISTNLGTTVLFSSLLAHFNLSNFLRCKNEVGGNNIEQREGRNIKHVLPTCHSTFAKSV